MNFLDYHTTYEQFSYFSLDDFLDAHADHEIVLCGDSIHAETVSSNQLREMVDDCADVAYLGEKSQWWDGTDRLFFQVIPLTPDELPFSDAEFEIVVRVGGSVSKGLAR